MFKRSIRTLLTLVAVALVIPAAAPVSAAELNQAEAAAEVISRAAVSAGDEITYWGWAVVRKPSEPNVYTPNQADAGNSTGGAVTVGRYGTGYYGVRFNGLTESWIPQGGVMHVSPIATKPRLCRIENSSAAGSVDLVIDVRCNKRGGEAIDTQFALSFLATADHQGTSAYLRTINGDHPVNWDEFFSFTSSGEQITDVTRTATGTYSVVFPGLTTAGGSMLVTSYQSSAKCRAGAWSTVAQGVKVGVRCYNGAGVLTDAAFMVSFMDGVGIKGFGGSDVAYLLSNQLKTASYTPPAAFRFSTEGGTPKVKHLSKGLYRVVLPNFGIGGAAIVTATGDGSKQCQLGALPTAGLPKKIDVRCFGADGLPANARFALSFAQ